MPQTLRFCLRQNRTNPVHHGPRDNLGKLNLGGIPCAVKPAYLPHSYLFSSSLLPFSPNTDHFSDLFYAAGLQRIEPAAQQQGHRSEPRSQVRKRCPYRYPGHHHIRHFSYCQPVTRWESVLKHNDSVLGLGTVFFTLLFLG